MKFQKSSLIVFVALAATITANSFKGCISVVDGKCLQCLERHVYPNGTGCGPARPQNDTCLIYGYNRFEKKQVCSGCKTGYADQVTIKGNKLIQTCVPGTIKGCLLEADIVVGNKTTTECLACPNNTYSVLNRTTRTSTCQKVAKPVPNCFWGSTSDAAGAKCARCKDGYAVDGLTNQCQDTVGAGCWIQLKGKCIACNPFEGFSIDANGLCFKTGKLNGVNEDPVKLLRKTLSTLGLRGF